MFLGDFPEDFTTVTCLFTTHQSTGAPVAPNSAFEAADVIIYKNGSATQKATTNGVTMTSPFDSITGLHCLTIDTSNDTGDGGFWVAGAVYTLVLSPDETVDSVAVAKVIGQFGIELYGALKPTTSGRKLDVSSGGEAGIDWANIGSPTTAVNLSGTNIDTDQVVASVSGAVGSVTGAVGSVTGNVGGNVTGSVGSVTGLTASDVAAIKAKTDNLPSDPADQSLIIAATDALATLIGDVPTNAELATALGTADDAVLSAISGLNNISAAQVNAEVDTALADVGLTTTITGRIDAAISTRLASASYTAPDNSSITAIKAKTDSLTFTVSGKIDANILYVNGIAITGDGDGTPWGPV